MKQVLWAAAWAAAAVVRADTIRVPEDVGSVQEAIDRAAEGDIVDIGHGVFAGGLSLRGKAITLRGRDGAEFTSLIGGDGVVRCVKNEGPATVIEGLTIGGGVGFIGPDGYRRGGGFHIDGASPRIRRCLIVGNTADLGPGAWIRGGEPVFEDCWFHDNLSPHTTGVVCEDVAPRFIRCGFHEDGVQWIDAPLVNVRSDCETPGGACCLGNHCLQTTLLACQEAGGFWHDGAACGSGVCPQFCLGDTNADRRINHTDLLHVLDGWGMCP